MSAGGVHGGEDVAAEEHGDGGEHRADDAAQPRAVGHIAAHLVVVVGAELLGRRDGEAAAHAAAEAHHQEVDGACGAHGGQSVSAQDLADDGGVDHAVELLEQVPEQNREAEAQNQ